MCRISTYRNRRRGCQCLQHVHVGWRRWRSQNRKSLGEVRDLLQPQEEHYIWTLCFSREIKSGESIDHYVTVLKNLANTCEFGALKESLIRNRIVFGIQDSSVRERLLRDAKLTLETAIEKVRSSELTQIQLKQIKADKTTDESISAITTEKLPEKLPSKFPMIDCNFCGRRHPRNKNLCLAYGSKCQKCGLANHFAKKCRTKETEQPRTGKRLHLVEIEDDTEDEFAIDKVTHKIGSLNTKSNDDVATQLFVTMTVNDNANIKFQLECEASCNLLPLKDYARVIGDPDDLYIDKSKAKLTMYNGAVMYPVGKCKLKCTRDGSSHVLEFQVVDGDVRPLLSAEWCQKLNFLKVLVKDPLHHVDTVTQDSQYTPSTSKTVIDDDILIEYADVRRPRMPHRPLPYRDWPSSTTGDTPTSQGTCYPKRVT